ncbi:type II toxin-antitoxin system VapC family toxin [Microbacterium sp.]|uniref:type II toxin-antitoxin system VapC family toxin n=1 Tax=Microbacterium sp. TaxID=51671 RepID=UPI003F98DE15
MRVVDANVLLYAVNEATPQHSSSARWLDQALDGGDTVGFGWNALLAFVRIATNPRIMPRPLSAEEAMAQVHDWIAAPSAHVLHPGERHASILEDLLRTSGTAANLVNDAHLAALAIEHRAGVVTFDTDFARFDGVRTKRPDELLNV